MPIPPPRRAPAPPPPLPPPAENDTSRSTGCSGRQNAATRRNMRREERVTVQGPVKEQQPDGMSHMGGGGDPFFSQGSKVVNIVQNWPPNFVIVISSAGGGAGGGGPSQSQTNNTDHLPREVTPARTPGRATRTAPVPPSLWQTPSPGVTRGGRPSQCRRPRCSQGRPRTLMPPLASHGVFPQTVRFGGPPPHPTRGMSHRAGAGLRLRGRGAEGGVSRAAAAAVTGGWGAVAVAAPAVVKRLGGSGGRK